MKTLHFTLMLFLLGSFAAQAQTSSTQQSSPTPSPSPPESAPSAPKTGEPVAPYDDKLLRLSEILGSIHYLRTLCGAKEDNKWRDTMSAIITAEEPGPYRRARLIAHFNRGYRSFSGSYSACTPSAILATERYMEEGASLSKQITQRYGR
jgi:uncharacterized protein (TIGR02301 family)